MFSALTEFYPYLVYAGPPLAGALIGYLTNRVAIRMLFRPLRTWRLGPFRIPMTPGVIPSKRGMLAANIGEMVGEHLLTGDEINRALQREGFQEHLQALIVSGISSITKLDLGSLRSIIPASYKSYFDIGLKTACYRIKEAVHGRMHSEDTGATLETMVQRWLDGLLAIDIEELLPAERRAALVSIAQDIIYKSLDESDLKYRLISVISEQLNSLIDSGARCADILPRQVQEAIAETVREQAPHLLDQAGILLRDPVIRERMVALLHQAIEDFIDGLGPMAAMARGFVKLDALNPKIHDWLKDNEDRVDAFLHDRDVLIRVRAALGARVGVLLATPLSTLFGKGADNPVAEISGRLADKVLESARRQQTKDWLGRYLDRQFEHLTGPNGTTGGEVLDRLVGPAAMAAARRKIGAEAVTALRSASSWKVIEATIDELCSAMVERPIGRLAHLIPAGVIEGVCVSLQALANRLLVAEVPGIVKSIDIRRIVAERIDSFDLLRLERLLLSIMADQFKYINLFGALLGFLIGCANVLLLAAIR